MSRIPDVNSGIAEFRAAWVILGIIALMMHIPLSPHVLLAIGIPWGSVAFLLARKHTALRLVTAWREVLTTRAGAYAAIGLGLVAFCVTLAINLAAGSLLGLWMAAAASMVGFRRGSATLKEQMAGWSLLAVVTVAALFAVEGVLRIPALGRRIGTLQEVESWWERYDGLWERNVLGMRTRYETLRKEPGVLRVVAVGDSFTWGDKIASSDSTWPAQLEQELRRRLPGIPVEVVNLGQKGHTGVNHAEMLRRLGWQFDPDVVVMQFYLNDILPSLPNFGRQYSFWLFPRVWLVPFRYRKGPLASSAILDYAEVAMSGLRHGDRARQAEKWTEVYQRKGPEWVDLANALKEMGAAAADRDVPIVLMLFPDFIPGMKQGEDVPFGPIHRQVAQAGREAGFAVLDLTQTYLRENPDMRHWWATRYDAHPNEAASRVAARTLAGFLVDSLAPDLRMPQLAGDGGNP